MLTLKTTLFRSVLAVGCVALCASSASAVLKVHYQFDQVDTTALFTDPNFATPALVTDASGNGINGLFRDNTGGGDVNKAVAVASPVGLGGAFDFETDDIVEFLVGSTGADGKAALTGSNPRTFAAWVSADSFADQRIVSYGNAPGFGGSFLALTLENDATGPHVKFRRAGGFQTYRPAQAVNPIALSAMVHVVMVVPAGASQTTDVDVYVNGELAVKSGGAAPLRTASSITDGVPALDDNDYIGVGRRGANANAGVPVGGGSQTSFDGQIADFQFYTTDLSADDILFLYNNPGAVITGPTSSIWTGNGGDANWGTAINWQAGLPDFSGGAAALMFPLSSNAAPNNEAVGRTVDSLTFDTDAQAYDISGEAFSVTDALSNNSAVAQTISAPVISGGATIGTPFADMTLASLTLNDATVIGPGGGNTLTINGLSGASDMTLSGAGMMVLTSDNTSYSGNIVMPRDDKTVLQVSHNNALGDTSGSTFVGTGPSFWLELLGDINVPEHIEISPKNGINGSQASLVNVSGDNTLSGTVSLVKHPTGPAPRAITFRIDAGILTLSNPISFELDGLDEPGNILNGGPRIRAYGDTESEDDLLVFMSNVTDDTPHGGDPNLDFVSVEIGAGANVVLNGANNTYSGITRVASDTATLVVNGTLSNTTPIELADAGSTLDIVGGLSLSSGQALTGQGVVIGGVTLNSGASISPTGGDLVIDGGLMLNNGGALNIDVGGSGGQIVVSSGQLTGSGVTMINLPPPSVPVLTTTTTLISAPGGISGLSAANFSVVEDDPDNLISSATLQITATEVQLVISSAHPIYEAIVTNSTNNTITLHKIQNNLWSQPIPFVANTEAGGLNFTTTAYDESTDEIFIFEGRAENAARPPRLLRLDRSGTVVEVVGTAGVDFMGSLSFGTIAPNGDIVFTTGVSNENNPTPPHVIAYRRGAGTFEEVASNSDIVNAGGVVAANTPALRGVTVTPDNRLFVTDKANEDRAVMEFNFLTGAFVGVFEDYSADPTFSEPQAITWDPIGNRLLLGINVGTADGIEEYANLGSLAATIFTPPSFPLYLSGQVEPAIAMGIHNFAYINGLLYVGRFHQNDVAEVDPDGVFDVMREVVEGLTGPTTVHAANVTECGRFDFDLDDDTDAADAQRMFTCLAGPENAKPAGCTDEEFMKADSDFAGGVGMDDFVAFSLAFGCGQ